MRTFIAVLFFFVISPSFAAAEATITDGDTLVLGGTIYRLDGIDAPETDQPCVDGKGAVWACGIEARDQLKKLTGKRDVRCDDKGPDTSNPKSKRRIGICWVAGETMSLNQWLVREGWALNFEPYAKGRFKADEDSARDNHHGLWKVCFAAPWDQRRGNKRKAELLGAACPSGKDKESRDLLFPDHPAMPPNCSIKGNDRSGIYHMEGCRQYQRLKNPGRWFCSEDEARAAGFRIAKTCRTLPR